MPRDLRAMFGTLLGCPEHPQDALITDPVQRQIKIAKNNGQQIVEMMRYAAGKQTDGLQLLGMHQRFLGLLSLLDLGAKLLMGGDQPAVRLLVTKQRHLEGRETFGKEVGCEFQTCVLRVARVIAQDVRKGAMMKQRDVQQAQPFGKRLTSQLIGVVQRLFS